MSQKLQYRVKPHAAFGPAREYKEGAVVELTAEEAAPFLDLLDLVRGKDAPLSSDLPPLQNDAGIEVPAELMFEEGIRLEGDKPKSKKKSKGES